MASPLKTLVDLSGPALGGSHAPIPGDLAAASNLTAQIDRMLRERNGFFAFEKALHVFPARSPARGFDLLQWNSPSLWRDAYADMIGESVFFSEDVFGNQFALSRRGVEYFDAETGELAPVAGDLEDWAQMILTDTDYRTGRRFAREWAVLHGQLADFDRLVPKTPFIMGGEFQIENMYALRADEAMRYRGEIAVQIRDLPDGAEIELVLKQ